MTKGTEYLIELFENKVNTVIDIVIEEGGSIVFDTHAGSSLISEIQDALTEEGLNEIYNIDDIEFIDYGDQHEYIIELID